MILNTKVKFTGIPVVVDIELDAVGRESNPTLTAGAPCGVTWDAVPRQSWY